MSGVTHTMQSDPWLQRWIALLRERADNQRVLEIGCGYGDDTAALSDAGFKVHAFDLSRVAVGIAKVRCPSAVIECRDLRDPLPEQAQDLGAIVASLSLHYFSWVETQTIVQKIHSALQSKGVLLCRLNSTQDHNFGASGYPQLEPNFYLVKNEPKRFFDKACIELLFAKGWRIQSLEHFTTGKYVKEKALWEVILERSDA
jgi:SAM-dependent methyltransferase